MPQRTATLTHALEIMRSALQLLDKVEAHLPAARLQHAIKAVVAEVDRLQRPGPGPT